MKKVLVQADNLDEFICRADSKLYVDGSMILTPGAKDELARRGVVVVHASCSDSASRGPRGSASPSLGAALGENANLEGLLLGVAAMLQKECGITDPELLKAASLQAIQTIKENL